MVWAKVAPVHKSDVWSCCASAPSRLSAALPWEIVGEVGKHGCAVSHALPRCVLMTHISTAGTAAVYAGERGIH